MNSSIDQAMNGLSGLGGTMEPVKKLMLDTAAQAMEFQTLMTEMQRMQTNHSLVMHARQDAMKGIADFTKESIRKSN
jgi:hypothetical protein